MLLGKSKSSAPAPSNDPILIKSREYVAERNDATTIYEALLRRTGSDPYDGSYGSLGYKVLEQMRVEQAVLEQAVNSKHPNMFIVKALAMVHMGEILVANKAKGNLNDLERRAGARVVANMLGSAISSSSNPDGHELNISKFMDDGTPVTQKVRVDRTLLGMPFEVTTTILGSEDVHLVNATPLNESIVHVSGTGINTPVQIPSLLETQAFVEDQLFVTR